MTLAMSWDEWASHDGIGLAERVRKGEVTAAELAAQAAASRRSIRNWTRSSKCSTTW